MEKFEIVMLIAIITLSIASTQGVTAEHEASHDRHNYDPELNLRYEVYLQTMVRDAQGQLLSVSESTGGWITTVSFSDGVRLPGLVDYVVDNDMLAGKKIVVVDNIKYQKIQFQTERTVDRNILANSNPAPNWNDDGVTGMASGTSYKVCGDFKGDYGHQCIQIFKAKTPLIHLAENNVIINQWTILRAMG